MEYIRHTTEFSLEKTAVTLGKFDGVHLGHQRLIKKVTDKKKQGYSAVVFTFDAPPSLMVKQYESDENGLPDQKNKVEVITNQTLLTNKERVEQLASYGVDKVVEYPFTRDFMMMSAEEFVHEIICNKLHAKYIVVGEDYTFGYHRQGNAKLLADMSHKCGFTVEILKKEPFKGQAVSSTRIRSCLKEGKMPEVNQLLGYDFFIDGKIVTGNQLGRTWGIPTINMIADEAKLLPPNGVYFSRVEIDDLQYKGITNIGYKPTIGSGYAKGVETYLYSCNEDLYGKMAKVSLLHFERPEQQFNDVNNLIAQLRQDINYGKEFFNL